MKRILVSADRCSGCRLCEMLCSFNSENAFGSSISRITMIKEDNFGLDLPVFCWHCKPCDAIESCETQALEQNEEGLVFVTEEKCIGCGKCLETCAIAAIKLHPQRKVPLICNQCNGKPLCVEKCPTKALTYRETETQRPKSPSKVIEEALRRWSMIA